MSQLSAPTVAIETPVTPANPPGERLVSLDLFRGATIALMIIVNNQDEEVAYWPLKHARWNGWTPTDLVFSFLSVHRGSCLGVFLRRPASAWRIA